MSDRYAAEETPSIEVRVFRHEALVATELCESEEDVARVLDEWSELEDVSFLVDDASFHHVPGDVLEPEPSEPADEEYPHEPTVEAESEEQT